ncbi:MAG: ArnT family glycosyltransferase [Blastocatellia bacterium]
MSDDEIEYDALAFGIVRNGSYTSHPDFLLPLYSPAPLSPTAFRPPGWPFILSIIYALFGHSVICARIILGVLGAIGAVCVFLIAMEVNLTFREAVVAGTIWALWPASVCHINTASIRLYSESLLVPVLLWTFLMLMYTVRSRSVLISMIAGAMLGFCLLIRVNYIPLAVAAILWCVARWRQNDRNKSWLVGVALSLSIAILPAIWGTRNYHTLGTFAVATQADILFFGNNAWTRGSQNTAMASQQFEHLDDRYPGFLYKSEVEKSRIYRSEAWAYVMSNKRHMIWVLWRKILILMSPVHETPGGYAYSFAYILMIPFFLLGVGCRIYHRDITSCLLLIPLATAIVTAMVVFGHPRYRYPAEPFMVILAIFGGRYLLFKFQVLFPRKQALAEW